MKRFVRRKKKMNECSQLNSYPSFTFHHCVDEKNTAVEDSIVGFGVENVLENGAGAFEFGQSLHSLRRFIAKIQQTAWKNDGQSLSRIFIFGTIFKSFDQRLKIE